MDPGVRSVPGESRRITPGGTTPQCLLAVASHHGPTYSTLSSTRCTLHGAYRTHDHQYPKTLPALLSSRPRATQRKSRIRSTSSPHHVHPTACSPVLHEVDWPGPPVSTEEVLRDDGPANPMGCGRIDRLHRDSSLVPRSGSAVAVHTTAPTL